MSFDKYCITEDYSDDKCTVKEIQPGLFSTKPQPLYIQNNKAYANLVVISKHTNIYGIYFTQQPGEIQLKNKFEMVNNGILINDFKECSKYLIHKLRRYKKIIGDDRYFTTEDPQELYNKIVEIIQTFCKLQENKKKRRLRIDY